MFVMFLCVDKASCEVRWKVFVVEPWGWSIKIREANLNQLCEFYHFDVLHVIPLLRWEWNLVVFDESGIMCMIVVILYNLVIIVLSVCNLFWCVNEIIEIWAIEQFGTSFILWKGIPNWSIGQVKFRLITTQNFLFSDC